MTFQGLSNYDMFKSNYEKQLIGKLRRLSIGARKLRLFVLHPGHDWSSCCVSLWDVFGGYSNLASIRNCWFSLLDLGTCIHRISPWWTGVTIPLFSVTLYFLATQSFRTIDMIRMKGIGLAHRHLLESVSIEFPPSRSLYSVILKKLHPHQTFSSDANLWKA
ncbi:hypothetical protein Ocin01_17347 [Orchesella cincta]|uniref:Uncharacterized protein n=1 Tax=Orchesella cincta TaxID=48709 RepID=A0A1D2M8T2_ORCCI|nr:hypothetical protein Ocin01_17347 [Orchesella cincta]